MAMNPVTGAAITAYFSRGDWDGYAQVSFTTVDRILCFYRIEYHRIGDPGGTWTWFGDFPWQGVFYGVSVKFAHAAPNGGPRVRTVDQIRITTTDLHDPPDTPASVIVNTPTALADTSVVAHDFYRGCFGEIGAIRGGINVGWQDLTKFVTGGRIKLEKNGLTSPETQVLYDSAFTSTTFGDHANFWAWRGPLLPPGILIPVDQNGEAYWDINNPPTEIDPNITKFWVAEGDLLTLTITTFTRANPTGTISIYSIRFYHVARFYQFADVATRAHPYSKQVEVIQDQWNPTPIVATINDYWNQLPAGLTVSPPGLISGTPTTVGVYRVMLFIHGLGLTNNGEEILIRVNLEGAPVIMAPNHTLDLTYGNPYPQQYSLYATNHPVTIGATNAYRITAGTLPAGVTLNGSNGLLSGTLTAVEAPHVVTFVAHNSVGDSAPYSVTFSVTLFDPPTITSSGSMSAFLEETATYQITTNTGALNYRAYDLPPGLGLIGSVITGVIPDGTAPGLYTASLQANNRWGWGPIFLLNITVGIAPPVISSPLTIEASIDAPFFYQIVASHSPRSYGADGLPSGLHINTATGVIAGVPTAEGTDIPVNLSATNEGGTGTAQMLLTIVLPPVPVIDTAATHGRAITAETGIPMAFSAVASHNPQSWTASPVPEGLNFSIVPDPPPGGGTSARLSGAFQAGGLFAVSFVATNRGGNSEPAVFYFLVTIGPTVAQIINELGTIMEIWIDLNSATVGIGNQSTIDEQGVIVIPTGTDLNLKRGDTQEISVIFHEDGIPTDVELTSLKFGIKPAFDDEFIVYTDVWTGTAGRFRIYPDFSGTNDDLDAVLVTATTTLMGEVQWEMPDDQGNIIRRSSVIFPVNIMRDLIHPD